MNNTSATSITFSKTLPKNKSKYSFDNFQRILSEAKTYCEIDRGDVIVRSGDLYEIPIEQEEVNNGISKLNGMMKITIEENVSEYEFIYEIDELEHRYALHVAIENLNNRSLELQKKFYSLMNNRIDRDNCKNPIVSQEEL